MKKLYCTVFFICILTGILYADDYKWDLVNALINNDFQKIEIILKNNINTMPIAEKRLVMSFTLTYSHGENTVKVLELLLQYNIRPNSFDLYTAINRNQSDAIIQFLLKNGAAANGEILLLAMEKQKYDLAKQCIETGIDVNYQYPLSKNYADGMTPLLYASKWNNLELVKLLLEHGANINARANDGNTALTMAQTNGNSQMYDYLKEHGAVEIGNSVILSSQNTGMGGITDNQIFKFQTGSYRLSGSNRYIQFSGNTNSGSISYVDAMNIRSINGFYRITGNTMTISMDGYTFIYRIDSNESFSGNGEIWIRIGK